MRKIILGLAAAAAIVAPLALAGSASAATTAPLGSTVFLSKSTLQNTLHLKTPGSTPSRRSPSGHRHLHGRPGRPLQLQRR